MSTIEGLNDVLKNIDRARDESKKAFVAGMDYFCRETVNYIKTDYTDNRELHGHGFTSRTHNLQNSMSSRIDETKDPIEAWIYATMEYAPYVELKWEGMYAYMWPGVNDKADGLKDILADAFSKIL